MDNKQHGDTRVSFFGVRAINGQCRLPKTKFHYLDSPAFYADRSVFKHPPFLASLVKARVDTSLLANRSLAFERQRLTP